MIGAHDTLDEAHVHTTAHFADQVSARLLDLASENAVAVRLAKDRMDLIVRRCCGSQADASRV